MSATVSLGFAMTDEAAEAGVIGTDVVGFRSGSRSAPVTVVGFRSGRGRAPVVTVVGFRSGRGRVPVTIAGFRSGRGSVPVSAVALGRAAVSGTGATPDAGAAS
jgi:hypothetical protein